MIDGTLGATLGRVLAGLPADRRTLFELRVERWHADLRSALAVLYPDDVDALIERLLAAAATAYVERPDDLHRLDLARTLRPDWFQQPSTLGYAAYTDRFAGTLAGVADQVPYLQELGVTYLHLMPLLLPHDYPGGDSDGGYAVTDYGTVRPDLGTVEDLAALTRTLRGAGISLVLDLVVNHVADDHDWARRARAGEARYRGYFHVFADRDRPDAYERTLPEVFPDFAPGNFTWDDDLAGWVWTTFNTFQWDVDWANPAVFAEYAAIVFDLANRGVEVLRLDAIAFLWKRLGTNCQNQPEVHAIAQALRALIRIACPAVLLKAEAIVAPEDLVQYLGRGPRHGKVSDLAYHNVLMVQVWSMLATRDVTLAVHTLAELPAIPSTTAWICYLRCHDDIGWAVDDGDAAAVGLNGFAHRAFLSDYYSGRYPTSVARGLVFQANPATGDRRISGTTAGLAGLEQALDAGPIDAAGDAGPIDAAGDAGPIDAAGLVGLAVRRILLAHAIVLGWGGVPVLWMGDELALPGDAAWAEDPEHAGDNRWLHRPRMDPARQAARHDPGTPTGQVYAGITRLARARADLPMMHAATPSRVLPASDPGVLAVLRVHPEGDLLELFNVTDTWRPWPAHRIAGLGLDRAADAFTATVPDVDEHGDVWLAPYQAMWLARRV